MEAPDDRSYRPRWLRFAPFLGRPPALTRHQWRVLGLVSIVSLFEQYDVVLFTMSLKQVQADLGLDESSLGFLISLVRSGALFALPLTLAADRFGRRRLLLVTILGYTLCTGATAFAPNATSFIVCQFLARIFAAAEMGIAIVVIAEEFDVEHRGWGMGALGALHACGAGVAGIAFAFVDVLPYGWRALYTIGLVPLLFVAYLRRSLPETGRFSRARERVEFRAAPPLGPALDLVRRHPLRLAILALAVVTIEMAMGPAISFAPKFLQDVHGWSPAQVAALTVGGGAFAIIGNSLAGWLSDRRGRRPVTVMFTCGVLVAIVGFYSLAGFPFAPFLWIPLVFGLMGTQVTLGAYGAEMFPTGVRSTASGVREFCKAGGAVLGLALVSVLFGVVGSNWTAIVILCAIGALSPLIVVLSFPETAGRSLEEIAPETEEIEPETQVGAPARRET